MGTKTKLEITSFNKGLITEAGPLTFPDNASLVDENMVLNKDGSRKRRLGLDYENDYTLYSQSGSVLDTQNPALTMNLWKNPTKSGSFDILVVQTSNKLKFFKTTDAPISGTLLNGGADLELPIDYISEFKIVTASLLGQLVVTYGTENLLYLSYDEDADVVSFVQTNLKIRDVFGIESAYEVDYRPTASLVLTPSDTDLINHIYNLRNQGWPDEASILSNPQGSNIYIGDPINLAPPLFSSVAFDQPQLATIGATSSVTITLSIATVITNSNLVLIDGTMSTISTTDGGYTYTGIFTATAVITDTAGHVVLDIPGADVTLLPSNADVFWRAKATTAETPKAVGAFSPYDLFKEGYGTSPAPKGKDVIDLFSRSADRQSFLDAYTGDPTLLIPTDLSTGLVSQVGAYAGRFFYAIKEQSLIGGDNSTPKLSTLILFSQVVKSVKEATKCYSEADVTSEFLFDTVATDGGFISLPDAGEILKLAPLGSSLFVFATNGVWEIFGGDSGFSATNQNVVKTSTIGALSSSSVVTSESILTYWAPSGIYVITIDQASSRGVSNNITSTTIQTYFNSIPKSEKIRARGLYDEIDRKLRWFYNTVDTGDLVYKTELVFDIDLKAFYVNYVQGPNTKGVIDLVAIPSALYLIGEAIPDGLTSFSFGKYLNISFKDFDIYDAPCTLLTGALTGGAGSSYKQIGDLVVHCRRTETGFEYIGDSLEAINASSCTVTSQWEWTDSVAAGKWGQPMQMYRFPRAYYPEGAQDFFDYGYTVITSKSGIRGRGHSLSLLFQSSPGKDMHILGWGIEVEVEKSY